MENPKIPSERFSKSSIYYHRYYDESELFDAADSSDNTSFVARHIALSAASLPYPSSFQLIVQTLYDRCYDVFFFFFFYCYIIIVLFYYYLLLSISNVRLIE